MTKLRLGPLLDDKPVKVTVELPAPLHRDLVAYAEVLARESGHSREPAPPAGIIAWNVTPSCPFAASGRVRAVRSRSVRELLQL